MFHKQTREKTSEDRTRREVIEHDDEWYFDHGQGD